MKAGFLQRELQIIPLQELIKIKGAHTNEIEGILGYKNYDNVIKKENIGILEEFN